MKNGELRIEKRDGGDAEMSTETLQILLVEDNEAHVDLIRRAFEPEGEKFNLTVAGTLTEARKIVDNASPGLMIVDYKLPDGKGAELLPGDPDKLTFPIVMLSGHGDERVAAAAIRAGALDYIVKSDQTLADMPDIIERILREWQQITERRQAEKDLRVQFDEMHRMNRLMVGRELKMEELRQEIKKLNSEIDLLRSQ